MQNKETAIRTDRVALTGAETNVLAKRAAKSAAIAALRTADSNGKAFIALFVRTGKTTIGGEWNATWEQAAHYHLVHAVALLALALCRKLRVWPWRLWLGGTVIFSGSLYVLALTNVKWLGAITPIGGTLLLACWLALAFSREKV